MDARPADPGAVPADEQGLLAAVRAVAAALVRTRAALAGRVRRLLTRRHRGVRDPLLGVRSVPAARRLADRCVPGRGARPCRGARVVPGRVGAPATARRAALTRRGRPRHGVSMTAGTAERRARGRSSLRTGFVYALKVFLGVRIGLFVLGLLSPGLFPPIDPVSVPGWPARPLPDPRWHNLFTVWERFDGLWFLRIADAGYRK